MSEVSIKKIAILGASGMVAQETIKAFDSAGFQLKLFSRSIKAENYPNHDTVKGDVFKDSDLTLAIKDCDAIHITLGQLDEFSAVQKIVKAAKQLDIKLISYVSGATVCKENTGMPFIKAKYQSEQLIKASGISYMIFRPTWFMESLALMIRDGKANVMGKQPLKLRWIASRDFGERLVNAYRHIENINQEFSTYGPESLTINEALEQYIKVKHPTIKKVANAPFWLLKILAFVSGNKQLKEFIPMFEYFEKTKEAGSPDVSDRLLGKSKTTLQQWLSN
ncbi:SDR family oxidoreductase [Pseudozobellia sp. WGM2]|uniref:SDR family oxidoreductase n=1 Tax=Pseudozobellia sp. WGM2 TaxID=2787625 RepID=UPI001ADF3D98|nr:NAD(P)-binding oxidoreductase [Pseudozobellia sp. WGM2]